MDFKEHDKALDRLYGIDWHAVTVTLAACIAAVLVGWFIVQPALEALVVYFTK